MINLEHGQFLLYHKKVDSCTILWGEMLIFQGSNPLFKVGKLSKLYLTSPHFNFHSAATAGGTNSNEKWCAVFTNLLSLS